MKNLDERINGLIQLMEVPVWLVQQYESVHCTCFDPVGKHGDPFCENCLGTGHKIAIKEARAHIQPTDMGEDQGYNIYLRNEFPVFPENFIVFGNKVILIKSVRDWYSNTSDVIYYQASGVNYKRNPRAFITNFNAIVGR